MNDRFFLDTNILVYTFDLKATGKARVAANLVDKAIASGKGVISYQVVEEFFNVAFKKFSPPMASDEAYSYFVAPLRPLLKVTFSQALLFHAIEIREKYLTGWYDGLILAAAVEGKCKVLYSEDLQHGAKIAGVRVVNPFI